MGGIHVNYVVYNWSVSVYPLLYLSPRAHIPRAHVRWHLAPVPPTLRGQRRRAPGWGTTHYLRAYRVVLMLMNVVGLGCCHLSSGTSVNVIPLDDVCRTSRPRRRFSAVDSVTRTERRSA